MSIEQIRHLEQKQKEAEGHLREANAELRRALSDPLLVIVGSGDKAKELRLSKEKYDVLMDAAANAARGYEITGAYIGRLKVREPRQRTYFIHSPALNAVKIGVSKNVKSRLQSLQCSSAGKLILLATLKGNKEAELHEQFSNARLSGEWFQAVPVIDWLQQSGKIHAQIP